MRPAERAKDRYAFGVTVSTAGFHGPMLASGRRRESARRVRSSQMLVGIDHLVIAVADPDAAADELSETLGIPAGGGGRHDHLGTYNRLIWLGDTYLELIARVRSHTRRAVVGRRPNAPSARRRRRARDMGHRDRLDRRGRRSASGSRFGHRRNHVGRAPPSGWHGRPLASGRRAKPRPRPAAVSHRARQRRPPSGRRRARGPRAVRRLGSRSSSLPSTPSSRRSRVPSNDWASLPSVTRRRRIARRRRRPPTHPPSPAAARQTCPVTPSTSDPPA